VDDGDDRNGNDRNGNDRNGNDRNGNDRNSNDGNGAGRSRRIRASDSTCIGAIDGNSSPSDRHSLYSRRPEPDFGFHSSKTSTQF
jgi:hypothetical protein